MARVRSGARYAPKHGQQYGEGYQFRPPQEFMYSYGPWDSIMPSGTRDLPSNALKNLTDGLINEGMIKAGWSKEVVSFPNRKLLAAFEMEFSQSGNHVLFWIDTTTGLLHVGFTAVSFSLDYVTALTPVGSPIVAVSWQNELYFSSVELGGIYKINASTGVVTAIAASPAAEFMVMLGNNLVAVYKVGGLYYEAAWSVDGNPGDWTGYGAGSNPLPNPMGAIKGVELLGDSIAILGTSLALKMSSTGFIPAFRFDDLVGFDGTPHKATASDGEYVYYLNYNGKLMRYNMSQSEPVGEGEAIFTTLPFIYFSRRLNRVVITSTIPACTLFLNPDNGKWNSNIASAYTHMADTPRYGGSIGSLILYSATSTEYVTTILERPGPCLEPEFTTGRSSFPVPVYISYIDIIFKSEVPRALILEVEYENEDASITSELMEADIRNRFIRYWIDRSVWAVNFNVSRIDTSPIWEIETAIVRIDVIGRSMTNEQIATT